jgi:hypothetical protein
MSGQIAYCRRFGVRGGVEYLAGGNRVSGVSIAAVALAGIDREQE